MHICISRWAAAARHPSRGQMSRNRETTKTRKPETKYRRPPEPEPSLMHSLHDSTRKWPRPWPIGNGTGNRALRSGPCGRLAGQASGSTPSLSASVSDKALAFLELAELPVRKTRRAPILHVSQRGVARCRGAHPRPPARPASR